MQGTCVAAEGSAKGRHGKYSVRTAIYLRNDKIELSTVVSSLENANAAAFIEVSLNRRFEGKFAVHESGGLVHVTYISSVPKRWIAENPGRIRLPVKDHAQVLAQAKDLIASAINQGKLSSNSFREIDKSLPGFS